jgi:phenylalanyl-tRNA synthetase beta subunit
VAAFHAGATGGAASAGICPQLLVDRGYQEVINFAFVEEAWEADFAANTNLIRLANPIASQMAVMRSTLFGGLVSNLRTNLNRKQSRVRLFETGVRSIAMRKVIQLKASISRGNWPDWLMAARCRKVGAMAVARSTFSM